MANQNKQQAKEKIAAVLIGEIYDMLRNCRL
ncbi:hypothetical protein J2S24_001350 [Thermoanaerobacter pentosaceus]|uniref:Uncharacterized protein n=1 Tax=Thermoanaerobacter pentosaceus TaxID=694059 RepID=A0ABT9M416_9THEO|nr:hypothetical protein [Thermoanaerobacter pentosaceus]